MTTWGVEGWDPVWVDTAVDLVASHGARLAGLVDQRLVAVHGVWLVEDADWNENQPLVLTFERDQLEVTSWKGGDYSVTWGVIDLTGPVVGWEGFTPVWRAGVVPDADACTGLLVTDVHVVEFRESWGPVLDGILLTFDRRRLFLGAGPDELWISTDARPGSRLLGVR